MATTEPESRIDPARVLLLRKTRHWTQDELSQAAGLSLRTVQRAEKTGRVSASTLKSLAAAFDVAPSDLEAIASGQQSIWWGPVGLFCGYGGALLGGAMSLRGLFRALDAGELTASEFGTSAGILGAAVGLSCALIGIIYQRHSRQSQHPTNRG